MKSFEDFFRLQHALESKRRLPLLVIPALVNQRLDAVCVHVFFCRHHNQLPEISWLRLPPIGCPPPPPMNLEREQLTPLPIDKVGRGASATYHQCAIDENNHKRFATPGNPLVNLAMYTLHTKLARIAFTTTNNANFRGRPPGFAVGKSAITAVLGWVRYS